MTAYTTIFALGDISNLKAADIFSVESTFVNPGVVTYLHSNGKGLYVWTVNNEDTMQNMVEMNVDAVITNEPVKCREYVIQYGVLPKVTPLNSMWGNLKAVLQTTDSHIN